MDWQVDDYGWVGTDARYPGLTARVIIGRLFNWSIRAGTRRVDRGVAATEEEAKVSATRAMVRAADAGQ